MAKLNSGGSTAMATEAEITGILGPLDTDKLLAILSLKPTVADVETALLWMSGDRDVFGADEPVKGAVSDIVTILTEGEDEEGPRD